MVQGKVKGSLLQQTRRTTPLHVAAEKGYDRLVKRLLLDFIPTKNKKGETALDLAISNGHESVARVLVESDYWEEVMAPSDTKKMSCHNEARITPMRKLIDKFPKVAKLVFEKCIETKEESTPPLKCKYYDLTYLDDTYMMPSEDGTELTAGIDPYDENGRLKKEAKAYSDDYDVVYKYHPLKMIANAVNLKHANAEKLKLLSEPLVIALINHKWNSLGRYVYYSALMIYIAFMVLFTLFVIYTPAPFNVYDADKNKMVDLSAYLYAKNSTCEEVPEFSTVPSAVLKTAVMMIGELEFTAIFHGDMHVHPQRLFDPEIAYPLFLFFCVIMTILLMNLLVGLAVDDIKGVQDKAELKRLSMQVDLVLQVEASMPYFRKLTTRSYYSTKLGLVPSRWKNLCTRFGFSSTEEKEEGTLDNYGFHDVRLSLDSINRQLLSLQEDIVKFHDRLFRTEAMVRKVLEHNKIEYEEDDWEKPSQSTDD
ncbi:unnamed protein product [Cylicocyclus nassatus]|uniref:Ion transport domain-containing protein n=1 Tax=Cylicocyclus nassatus TaxID=53992 RepID=A0AA36M7S4_CYLNA|nr:unnamed protein product [Cylicocyclus nassatus]